MQPLEVDVDAWLEPRYPVHGRLLESTHVIGTTGQVLSMLWLAGMEQRRECGVEPICAAPAVELVIPNE